MKIVHDAAAIRVTKIPQIFRHLRWKSIEFHLVLGIFDLEISRKLCSETCFVRKYRYCVIEHTLYVVDLICLIFVWFCIDTLPC